MTAMTGSTTLPSTSAATATTMSAAVLTAPGTVELRRAPIPQPAANQVRVRLEGCGVCASNLPPWEGRDWFQYPMSPGELGHEGWGRVDALGPDVTDLHIGDRVAMISNHAYAQYDLAPRDAVIPLPPPLSAGDANAPAFPGEPLGCAVNIFRRSGIADGPPGQTVAIVGVGFLGALLIQLARRAGARVIAISRRPFSLDVARRMGAHETVEMDDHTRVIQHVAALTGGSGGYNVRGFCDCVIECTGKQWPLQLASELCAVRGRLVIAGYHQDGMRSVNMQLWNWRGLDIISAHERDPAIYADGIRRAAQLVADGTLDPFPLLTHSFPLARLDDALHMTRDRPDGFVKAVIRIHGPPH